MEQKLNTCNRKTHRHDNLIKKQKKFVQQEQVTSDVFLYYARAVDSTMLVALSAIAAEQGAPMQNTLQKVNQFLDYAASDMKLTTIHSMHLIAASQRRAQEQEEVTTFYHMQEPIQLTTARVKRLQSHKSSDVVCGRGRIVGSTFHQCQNSNTNVQSVRGIRTFTASDTSTH